MKRMDRPMTLKTFITRTVLTLGAGTALFFGTAWALSTETRAIPETQVGFMTIPLDVEHRDKTLDLHIWYPTDAAGKADLIAQNALMYGFHAHPDATPRAGAFPLVVLSHGSGRRMTQMAWLATALTQQGYIVAGVNHHGTTSKDSDPHRTIEIWDRPADHSAILDVFEAGPLRDITADMSNITSAGFSLGGHTALALAGARVQKAAYIEYCDENAGMLDCGWMTKGGVDFNDIDAPRYEASHKDARITATFAIDPALPQAMGAESLGAMALPTLLLNLGDYPQMPVGIDAAPLMEHLPNAKHVAFAGSWHMSGIGECSPLGRLIIGASEYFTGEVNICGEAKRYRTIIQEEMVEEILPFMRANRAKSASDQSS
jgi:predicted dienelactone hydrolase